MKKIIVILFLLLIFLSACQKDNRTDNENNNKKDDVIENKDNEENVDNENKLDNNVLIAYFSATNNTENIATKIQNKLKCDIFEIEPQMAYTSADLNYNSDCRANREQNDSKARPEIENTIDITKYDTIYLGYPIWWGTNPKIILTLLDTYDFTNKTIIPFCTSGSTGISGSVNDLRSYNNKLNIKDGKRFSSNDSDEIIKDFINNN